MGKKLHACPKCGCTDITHAEFVWTNTGKIVQEGYRPDDGSYYCLQCDETFRETKLVSKPQPYQEQVDN